MKQLTNQILKYVSTFVCKQAFTWNKPYQSARLPNSICRLPRKHLRWSLSFPLPFGGYRRKQIDLLSKEACLIGTPLTQLPKCMMLGKIELLLYWQTINLTKSYVPAWACPTYYIKHEHSAPLYDSKITYLFSC